MPHIEKIEDDIPTVSTIVAIGGHARWDDYEAFLGAHDATDPGKEGAGPTSRSSSTRRARRACPRA